jgi:hypothetical protein
LIVIQRQLGHTNLGITSVYLQGIDNTEIIDTIHPPRADGPRRQLTPALTPRPAAGELATSSPPVLADIASREAGGEQPRRVLNSLRRSDARGVSGQLRSPQAALTHQGG